MKKITLGLSLFLLLIQNGFAKSDTEWNKLIDNESDEYWKQSYKCDKEALNHKYSGNVNECLKSIVLQRKKPNGRLNITITYLNTGVLYQYSTKNYIKAYQYYIKAAKLGNIKAQSNLDILCRQHSWVCKQ